MIVMGSSENEKETKNYVEFVFYRVPKKNHESLLQVALSNNESEYNQLD